MNDNLGNIWWSHMLSIKDNERFFELVNDAAKLPEAEQMFIAKFIGGAIDDTPENREKGARKLRSMFVGTNQALFIGGQKSGHRDEVVRIVLAMLDNLE